VEFTERITRVIREHPDVLDNPSRETMIQEAVDRQEAIVSANGVLATWTPIESTGRWRMCSRSWGGKGACM